MGLTPKTRQKVKEPRKTAAAEIRTKLGLRESSMKNVLNGKLQAAVIEVTHLQDS